uniref:Uncharacterized protein n=1 Tax=Oryza rufipogon TaxID=4529 RepID=A0A0E0NYR2_ORYRU
MWVYPFFLLPLSSPYLSFPLFGSSASRGQHGGRVAAASRETSQSSRGPSARHPKLAGAPSGRRQQTPAGHALGALGGSDRMELGEGALGRWRQQMAVTERESTTGGGDDGSGTELGARRKRRCNRRDQRDARCKRRSNQRDQSPLQGCRTPPKPPLDLPPHSSTSLLPTHATEVAAHCRGRYSTRRVPLPLIERLRRRRPAPVAAAAGFHEAPRPRPRRRSPSTPLQANRLRIDATSAPPGRRRCPSPPTISRSIPPARERPCLPTASRGEEKGDQDVEREGRSGRRKKRKREMTCGPHMSVGPTTFCVCE